MEPSCENNGSSKLLKLWSRCQWVPYTRTLGFILFAFGLLRLVALGLGTTAGWAMAVSGAVILIATEYFVMQVTRYLDHLEAKRSE